MLGEISWLILIASLPGQNSAARVRVWRALKASGAAALRDGVYLLPRSVQNETVFREQAAEIEAAGGSAHLAEYRPLEEHWSDGDLIRLFDRTAEYADILGRIEAGRRTCCSAPEVEARRAVAALRRDFATVAETDFFPGASRDQVEQALTDLEAGVNAHFSPDEPHAASGALRRRAPAQYRERTWATRAHLWVDRVASAWLIRRFVDPAGRFLWLADVGRCPPEAVGFDFDGAEFSHVGTRVTYEVLAFCFGLDSDPALARIGAMVHYLDVGGIPIPEAAGFVAILAGARATAASDDALLQGIAGVLDALYAASSTTGLAPVPDRGAAPPSQPGEG